MLDAFRGQLVLQLLVLVGEARDLKLKLFSQLLYLHSFAGLKLSTLLIQLPTQLSLGISRNYQRFLVFAHLCLKQLLQLLVLFEQTLNFLLELVAVDAPLVLLPPLLLKIAFQLAFPIAPLFLLLPKLLLNLLP